MAHAVEQRTREIGIRVALGAGGWDVLSLIVRQAVVVIVVGAAIGIAAAMALTRYLSSEIWEVSANDPGAFVSFTLVLAAIAVVACLIPTRRAVKIDPTIALRYE
jgi:putative ABC transport system permease protein